MEGASREEAVTKFKTMMDQPMITSHMQEKHPGQPVMSVEECHAMIEKDVVAA